MRVGDESRRGARGGARYYYYGWGRVASSLQDDVFVRALFPHQTRVQYGHLTRRVVHLLSVLDAATDVGRGVSRADGAAERAVRVLDDVLSGRGVGSDGERGVALGDARGVRGALKGEGGAGPAAVGSSARAGWGSGTRTRTSAAAVAATPRARRIGTGRASGRAVGFASVEGTTGAGARRGAAEEVRGADARARHAIGHRRARGAECSPSHYSCQSTTRRADAAF